MSNFLAINVNSDEFWKNENVTNISYGNGLNYGYVENKNGSFRLFRYYTNGWKNDFDGFKLFGKEVDFPEDFESADDLWNN